jgi:hypothetical protein
MDGCALVMASFQDRWDALSRYDDEVRAATEQVRKFGDQWVDKLARAFFALHEDRTYLPNIVERLVDEAKLEVNRRQQEAAEARQKQWLLCFRQTADGELCSEESLRILREAERHGYALEPLPNRAFKLTKGDGVSYLHSNYDIQRFGRYLLPKQI